MYKFINENVSDTWLGKWVEYRFLSDLIYAGFTFHDIPALRTAMAEILSIGNDAELAKADGNVLEGSDLISASDLFDDYRDERFFLQLIQNDYRRRMDSDPESNTYSTAPNSEEIASQIAGEIEANRMRIVRLWRERELITPTDELPFSAPVKELMAKSGLDSLRDIMTPTRVHMFCLLEKNYQYLLELQQGMAQCIIQSIEEDQVYQRPYAAMD